MNILEIGTFTGTFALTLLCQGYPLSCLDFSREALEIFRQKLKLYQTPPPKSIIEENIFDFSPGRQYHAIIGSDCIHHIAPTPEKISGFFQHIKHLLQPKGKVAFIEPYYSFIYPLYLSFCLSMNWRLEKGISHMRPYLLSKALSDAGFEKIEFKKIKSLLPKIFIIAQLA